MHLVHPRRPVPFTRDDRGIHLDLSGPAPDPIAPIVVLELDGPAKLDKTMFQTLDGAVRLTAERAEVHGDTIRLEPNGVIGFWSDLAHWLSWRFVIARPGTYWVGLTQSVGAGQHGARDTVAIDDKPALHGVVRPTGGWEDFLTEPLGVVDLSAGRHTLSVRPTHIPQNWVMNLREVVLKPTAAAKAQ